MKPSAYGFKNIKPRTRDERRSLKDKEALEKSRIIQRVGLEAREYRRHAPTSSAALTTCTKDAAGYLSDADRFHTDTAGEQKQLRQMEIEKRRRADEFRRNQGFKREEQRWLVAEEAKMREAEYWQRVRQDGMKSRKNQSNSAYDVVSLEYNKDEQGEMQKYHDDMIRYRAKLRAMSLMEHGDTRAGYNIISGEAKPTPSKPIPLEKPKGLLEGERTRRLDYRSGREG